jgi:hypothetical protein
MKLISKMKSENPLIRVLTLANIRKDLHRYLNRKQKFSMVDARLLNGIIESHGKKLKQQSQVFGKSITDVA